MLEFLLVCILIGAVVLIPEVRRFFLVLGGLALVGFLVIAALIALIVLVFAYK